MNPQEPPDSVSVTIVIVALILTLMALLARNFHCVESRASTPVRSGGNHVETVNRP